MAAAANHVTERDTEREREREREIDFFHTLDTKFFSARSILQWEEEAAEEEEADQFAVTKLIL